MHWIEYAHIPINMVSSRNHSSLERIRDYECARKYTHSNPSFNVKLFQCDFYWFLIALWNSCYSIYYTVMQCVRVTALLCDRVCVIWLKHFFFFVKCISENTSQSFMMLFHGNHEKWKHFRGGVRLGPKHALSSLFSSLDLKNDFQLDVCINAYFQLAFILFPPKEQSV